MSTLFIKNPYCRHGDADMSNVEEALARIGDVETLVIGGDVDPVERLAADHGFERIVVAGGDGTLNAALPAVLKSGLPLGIVPCGTANDFARSMALPEDPAAAAEIIAHNCTRQVDVGVVNGRHFLNAAGIGLGPELTRQLDREKKKRLGVLAYLESLIEVIGKRRRRYATITVDGETIRASFLQITVASGRYYGGGMTVADDAEPDDGLLDMLCVRPLSTVQLFLRALRLRNGEVRDDEKLIHREGKKVEIRTRRRSDVTADGELVTTTPITCEVLNKALTVFVPREEAAVGDDAADLAEASAQETQLRPVSAGVG